MEKKATFKELKLNAKNSLKNKWGLAIVVTLLNFIILILPNCLRIMSKAQKIIRIAMEEEMYIHDDRQELMNSLELIKESLGWTIILWAFKIVVVGALTYGITKFFVNLIRNNNAKIENLFEGFRLLGKTILINIVLGIFTALWTILEIIIIVGAIIISSIFLVRLDDKDIYSDFIVISLFIIILVCTIVLKIFLNRYALTYYIANDYNEMEIMDIVNKSVKMMKGKKIRLFLLNLSFIGWNILGVISFGIGFLWITPYLRATNAAFYNSLLEQENRSEELQIK